MEGNDINRILITFVLGLVGLVLIVIVGALGTLLVMKEYDLLPGLSARITKIIWKWLKILFCIVMMIMIIFLVGIALTDALFGW